MTQSGAPLFPSSSVSHLPDRNGRVSASMGETLNIQLHRMPPSRASSIDAWVWHISGSETLHDLDTDQLSALQTQGWELLDLDDISFFLPLISQLADTIPVTLTSAHEMKTLARVEAIVAARQFPVILAFAYQDQDTPPMLPGPPAQLGELGIIFDEQQHPHTYLISHLGEEGTLLCKRLRASVSVFLSLTAPDDERDAAWGSAQALARELAERYWYYHQQSMELGEQASYETQGNEEQTLPSHKRSHRKLPSATTLLAGEPGGVVIPYDPLTQLLMQSLLDSSRYVPFEDDGYAEHVPLSREQNVRITIRPGSGEEWESVLQSLKMLGDEVTDTFCALLAIAIDVNNEHITEPFFLDVDDILRVCQRRMSNRTFTPLQRLRVVEHLRALTRVHITASRPGQDASPSQLPVGKKNARKLQRANAAATTLAMDSTVLDLLGATIGEYKTLSGEPMWERRQVKIGMWADHAPSLSIQTAVMLRKVLAYHAQRQRQEKRIGRWLTLQFQAPSRRATHAVECSTRTLLEQSGIKVNLNTPGEVRTGIEEAVEQLLKDNVIGAYQRVIVLGKTPVGGAHPFEHVWDLEDDPPSFEVGVEAESEAYWKTIRQHIRIASEAARDIRTRIEQRARAWWLLYTDDVWWRFESPLPPDQYERKLLVSQHD